MENVTSTFAMSMAELALTAGNIHGFMERDAAEFASRGVDAAALTAFETQINTFENLYDDAYYRGEISLAVEEKNAARDATLADMQKISGFFEQKWGINSVQYRQLQMKNIHDEREAQFYILAKRMVLNATAKLAELTPEGLVQGDIDSLSANAQLMEDKLHEISMKEGERGIKAQQRIELANELYAALTRYCRIGKLIWENVDAAKYDDYEIHKTVTHGLSKVQNFTAAPGGNNSYNLAWSPVVSATNYEIEFAEATTGQPKGAWQLYDTVNQPNATFVATPGFTYWLRVRARNTEGQTGGWSDEVIVEGV